MSSDQQNSDNIQPINNSYSAENLKEAGENDRSKGAHFAPTSDDHESYNKNDNDNKSFGMKLGQIQNKSISLMKEIICLEPTVKEISLLQEIPDENEEQQDNSNNDNNANDNDEETDNSPKLFGRLEELDEEYQPLLNGIAYQTLLTGTINQSDDLLEIKRKLRTIVDVCINKLWIDETAYINDLIEAINYYLSNPTNNNNNNSTTENNSNLTINKSTNISLFRTGFWRENPQKDIEEVYNRMGVKLEKIEKELDNINAKRTEALNILDQQYIEESTNLDERYQNPTFLSTLPFTKPSKELLDLRYKAQKLLKQNKIKEATEIVNKIKIKERTEAAANSQKIKEKYYNDDRRLKEQYATKRHNIELNFDLEVSRLNAKKKKEIQKYENYISKLRRQIDHDSELLNQTQTKNQNEATLNNNSNNNIELNSITNSRHIKPSNFTEQNNINYSFFLESGHFEPKAPKMLNRSNDLAILDKMTEELLNKTASSPRKSNIDKIFRQTKRDKK